MGRDVAVALRAAQIKTAAGGDLWSRDGVSFTFYSHRAYWLTGDSGVGKTTVGRLVAGLVSPDRGEVCWPWGTRMLARYCPDYQWIPQETRLAFDPRSLLMVSFLRCVKYRRLPSAAIFRTLKEVGLPAERLGNYPDQLSGGEIARAALARSILTLPRMLVADEITAQLDWKHAGHIEKLLMRLAEQGTAVIFIAHEQVVAYPEGFSRLSLGLTQGIREQKSANDGDRDDEEDDVT